MVALPMNKLIVPLLFLNSVMAEPTDDIAKPKKIKVDVSGFVQLQFGVGDRYGKFQGEDSIGFPRAALEVGASYENIKLSVLAGASRLSHTKTANADKADFEEVKLGMRQIKGSKFSASIGLQSLNLGLKANGYAGDRSIQPSLEFGGAGGFAYSNQLESSLLVEYDYDEKIQFSGGLFDTDQSSAASIALGTVNNVDGSSMIDNVFLQARANDWIFKQTYGVVSLQRRYVGIVDAGKMIYNMGFGYQTERVDVSYEWIGMDDGIVILNENESYHIFQCSVFPKKDLTCYLDWATASERDIDTIRLGVKYQYSEPLELQLEYSKDDSPVNAGTNVDSVDFRVQFDF